VLIRRARRDDLHVLRDVEVRAGARFCEIGMDEIADDEPAPIADDATVWVVELDDEIVGYVLVAEVDDAVHIEQVSVVPEAAGRGVGATLIDRAAEHARELGLGRLTLTTFRDVAWNAPYYERLGFAVVLDAGPELAALVAHERTSIPGVAARVAMERPT
jgi:GNAT superfamily N-acetyltransferase